LGRRHLKSGNFAVSLLPHRPHLDTSCHPADRLQLGRLVSFRENLPIAIRRMRVPGRHIGTARAIFINSCPAAFTYVDFHFSNFDYQEFEASDTPQLASSSSFRILIETNPGFPHPTKRRMRYPR
jgi:hypothetical protein